MSYCRYSDDSDVYVFGSSDALECCGCSLYKHSARYRRYSQMLKHLAEHVRKFDRVPTYALERLQQEQETYHDRYPHSTKKRLHRNVRTGVKETKYRRLCRELKEEPRRIAALALSVFERIYKRKPTHLEMAGLADLLDIKVELYLFH